MFQFQFSPSSAVHFPTKNDKPTVEISTEAASSLSMIPNDEPVHISSYYRYIGQKDSVTISVWNHKKIHKKQGAGFLGCVRIMSNTIQQLKDTGCKYIFSFFFPASFY